jgi:hypothetical protein
MTQGVLPFKYEEEKNDSGMTALAGLPIYLDLARVFGLSASIAQHVKIRENTQGWTDQQWTGKISFTGFMQDAAKARKYIPS